MQPSLQKKKFPRFMHVYAQLIVLAALPIIVSMAIAASPAPKDGIDLMTLNQGIDKSSQLRPKNINPGTDNEFLDFSRAFVKKDGKWIFTIPAEDAPGKYHYVGFGPFPVQPQHRYSLIMESANLSANFANIISITFLKGDTPIHFNCLGPKENNDFGTPPDADRVVLWFGVSALTDKLTPGPAVELKSLKVVDRGLLNGTSDLTETRPGENLLPVSDFENEPSGEFVNRKYFYPGNGIDAKKNKNVFAEIVSDGSNKCLHIVSGKNCYIYPYFISRKANLNNSTLVFTCRVKGKGKVMPGIWWWLKGVKSAWSYYHEVTYELTDTWQNVCIWRACMNDTDFAAVDLFSSDSDYMVDDLSLVIIRPVVEK